MGCILQTAVGHCGTGHIQKTLSKLRVTHAQQCMTNKAATVVAVDYKHIHARDLIIKWKLCAHKQTIIAPKGSNRTNHRQDQAVLSVLVNQAIQNGYLHHIPSKCLGFSIHNDVD